VMSDRALDSAAVRQAARSSRPRPVGLDRRRPRDRSVAYIPMGRVFGLGSAASVAQHSLAVLALRRSRFAECPLPIAEARRELLHDAT
jgi:hypothetical protein